MSFSQYFMHVSPLSSVKLCVFVEDYILGLGQGIFNYFLYSVISINAAALGEKKIVAESTSSHTQTQIRNLERSDERWRGWAVITLYTGSIQFGNTESLVPQPELSLRAQSNTIFNVPKQQQQDQPRSSLQKYTDPGPKIQTQIQKGGEKNEEKKKNFTTK